MSLVHLREWIYFFFSGTAKEELLFIASRGKSYFSGLALQHDGRVYLIFNLSNLYFGLSEKLKDCFLDDFLLSERF